MGRVQGSQQEEEKWSQLTHLGCADVNIQFVSHYDISYIYAVRLVDRMIASLHKSYYNVQVFSALGSVGWTVREVVRIFYVENAL